MNLKLLIHNLKYHTQIKLNKIGWHVSKYHKLKIEDDTYQVIKRLLGKTADSTIFDVGAWVGKTSQVYLDTFPNSCIHAFEPFPSSFEKLKEHFEGAINVYVNELALSDMNGTAKFYYNNIETTNSLLESAKTLTSDDFFRENNGTIEVETMPLDDYCLRNDIKVIDILKLDVQGGEMKVLEGARQLLKSQSISLILCEVEFIEHYKEQPLYHDIAFFLKGYGYSFYNFYGSVVNEYGELSWADALFYSEKLSGAVKKS
jgi:FkbM family methyltransferase